MYVSRRPGPRFGLRPATGSLDPVHHHRLATLPGRLQPLRDQLGLGFRRSGVPLVAVGSSGYGSRLPGTDDLAMPYTVDFDTVSTARLGVVARSSRARWFARERGPLLQEQVRPRVHRRARQRGPEDDRLGAPHPQGGTRLGHRVSPLEATAFQVENIRMAYVFYESGLSINVMYTVDAGGKRAVGFKLSDGMDVPAELASRFKFARQKSKLAGTIRGSSS